MSGCLRVNEHLFAHGRMQHLQPRARQTKAQKSMHSHGEEESPLGLQAGPQGPGHYQASAPRQALPCPHQLPHLQGQEGGGGWIP